MEDDRWIPGARLGVGWFSEAGGSHLSADPLKDNGPSYALGRLAEKPGRAFGSQAHRTKPYTPQTNRERGRNGSQKNHSAEWAYVDRLQTRMNATAGYPAIWGI